MARILIVDDTPHIHRLLTLMLQRINHTTITADSGLKALEELEKTAVDPHHHGFKHAGDERLHFVRKIRAKEKFKNLPIIMLSATGEAQASDEAREKGANQFMSQPISTWELTRVVSECLSLRAPQMA
ncbi:MAG: response regulator [Chloroflexi bacterium]|nr:response regulator [Chloroflexota bacterium]